MIDRAAWPFVALVTLGLLAGCTRASESTAANSTAVTSVTANSVTATSVAVESTAGTEIATTLAAAQPTSTTSTLAAVAPGATTPATTVVNPTDPPAAQQPLCLDQLDLAALAGLVVWPSVYSADWDAARETVGRYNLGGVLLMRPSGWDAETLTARLDELEQATRFGVLVATDEEGGDVQRLALLGVLPSQYDVSQALSPDEAYDLIAEHAGKVRATGVDVVLGPVVDVLPATGQPSLQSSRFFAGDPAAVSVYASAYIDAWQSAGLTPVLKHFPGHGAASADTHDAAGTTPPLDALTAWDLEPYRALDDRSAAVMVGHLTVPGLTEGLPATRSPQAVAYLRDTLGYQDALLISDALGMGAVGLEVPEAAVASLIAGIDVVIFTDTNATGQVIDAIIGAVDAGRLPRERLATAAARVLRLMSDEQRDCRLTP